MCVWGHSGWGIRPLAQSLLLLRPAEGRRAGLDPGDQGLVLAQLLRASFCFL